MARKRQQQIYFRSLAMPPSNADIFGDSEDGSNGKSKPKQTTQPPDYCPHFLAALQLVAHVMVPLRKALVHFYVSYRNKDVQKLEWLTMLAMGRLFRDLITASSVSDGNSVLSGGSSSFNDGSTTCTGGGGVDPSALRPVSTERFFPVLYTCLLKHDLEKRPSDATEAIRVLLDCLKCCSRTLPVTNQLWGALLDKACLGLIVSQSLVGRRKIESIDQTEVIQRSHTEQVIMWCPHVLSINDVSRIIPPTTTNTTTTTTTTTKKDDDDKDDDKDDDDDEKAADAPTLFQLMEADFKKRPLSTTSRNYYDFDKKSYDFEVEIPTKFLDKKDAVVESTTTNEKWNITRSMQFSNLTGYLFLGIDRKQRQQQQQPVSDNGDEDDDKQRKIDRSELSIPATLNISKLCSKKKRDNRIQPNDAIYELVGGALFDDGEYIAVLKDSAAVALAEEKKAGANGNGNKDNSNSNSINSDDEEEEDETWKLMELEETIPMSESDVLEFLKGEGTDENDDDESADSENEEEDEYGPCGTLAVYKLKQSPSRATVTIFDEMNQLLSDIVISQVSGSLNSKTDYYIEEEIYEEEIIED